VLYGSMRKHMAAASAEGRASSAAALRALAERAATLGIKLSLEVVNRYESNLLNTGRQALEFLKEIDRPEVSVHLDTYHMNIEESDLFQPILDTADRLGYFHIGESHRGYLGTGSVDFGSAFRALDRIGYDSPIVFESFSSAVVSPTLSTTLGVWRNLWNDGDDLGVIAADVGFGRQSETGRDVQTLGIQHPTGRRCIEGRRLHQGELDQVEAGPPSPLHRALDAGHVEVAGEHQRVTADQ
jgi:D-psicose/D-tagatose/L-ribulose 3-epimerase